MESKLRITIIDEITGIEGKGTVVYREPDSELPIEWLYCVSDYPEKNDKYEPKLDMMIWRIIDSNSNNFKIEEVED